MSNKFVLSYSGGKDCILALYRKIEQGDIPVALLTTVKKSSEETWTHGLSFDLLEQVSKSLELPIIYAQCDVSEYEDVFEEKLREAKKMGATSVVYGDIDSGFKAVIKKVNLDYLSEDFLGKTLTKELIEKIKSKGVDPCGENGEYHTFVVDGPIFDYKINIKHDESKIEENYALSIM